MNETIEYQNIHGNRQYKDTLFRTVFSKKEDLLDLYNAINGTSYENAEELEVNTLENVLYMSMKNDISFMIGWTMNLYEHQSTKNANMPLRGLLYFAKLYDAYITENALELHNSKLLKIPTPKYIVFYNGKSNEPDERILKLSDAFIKEGGCLECEAKLLNINYGRNLDLMEKCRRLEEYAIFVEKVRVYKETEASLKKAITQAIDESIKEGVLEDILTKQRSEVLEMVLSTFNKELYEKNLKNEAFEEGIETGRNIHLQDLVKIKLAKGKTLAEIADALEESEENIAKIIEEIKAG